MKRWLMALSLVLVGALAGSFILGPILQGQTNSPAPETGIPRELTSYRDVVKKVLPAVVSIESKVKEKARPKTKQSAPKQRQLPDDFAIPKEFRKFFEDFGGQPFQIPDQTPHSGFGSGFLVDPKGVVLTNWHVVNGADEVVVTLSDGRQFVSTKIATDRQTDLAIVRLDVKDGKALPYLELGNSEAMEIGDRVLAVGAPFGLTGTVTAGIVSAKGRHDLNMNMYEDFLQTDAAINPGNSGGPLVNLEGKVIGINAAIKSRSGGSQGIGLAVASNLARNVMRSLTKDGVVHRGYLGIQIQALKENVAEKLGLKGEKGVIVSEVYPNTPAANAKIKAGDVLTAIGGQQVTDGRTLQTVVAGLPIHKSVDAKVFRDGEWKTLPVTIEEQPQDFGKARAPAGKTPRENPEQSTSVDKLGVEISKLTPALRDELGFNSSAKGVVITRVDEDSPASAAGLRRGMLIVKVDRQAVTSAENARGLLEKADLAKGVLLQVQTPEGAMSYVVLQAAAAKG
jgi:serine protease Do